MLAAADAYSYLHLVIVAGIITFAVGVKVLARGSVAASLPGPARLALCGGVALYLLCGVIFPIDLMPRALQALSLCLPFTYWYEAMRRFLLGHGASAMLSRWSDARLLAALAATTLLLAAVSRWGPMVAGARLWSACRR